MQSHALSSQSSLRGPHSLMAYKGNTPAGCRTPPPCWTVNGGIHFSVAVLEAVAKASHQNLILPRPPHGKSLLYDHRTAEADGVGGISFSMIWGGDIQTPDCCQKLTTTPGPRGHRCLPGKRLGLFWANSQHVELGPVVPQCHYWAWR